MASAVQHERVAAALVAAAAARDERGLRRLLHPGARLTVDGGGVVAAPPSALEGASEVGAYLVEVLLSEATAVRVESVNGMPGIVVCSDGRVAGVLGLRVRGRSIVEAWLVLNPEKLMRWTC